MPSILPGYEYDIFISYRQNDNRSGWVTEFVRALEEELVTTIKDPVSVYFDIKPHDGLLETHHVGKSLEGKLKCLIFVPILSQTYCDPKSFAWQYEFCAFNKLASEDQFGRHVQLSNGNVTSRILPVKIHELDAEDRAIIEGEIGGPLRAIEFIYKEPGVNRPLKPSDVKSDNQNKTDYHNQINKVANAIKEIIVAVRNPKPVSSPAVTHQSATPKATKKRLLLASVIAGILLLIGYGFFRKPAMETQGSSEQSIAVLPFVNLSNDPEQEYFSDGLSDDLITLIGKIEHLKVTGRTSSFQFKNKNIDLREIGDQLDVRYLLEGTVQKSGTRIRVTIKLIDSENGKLAWSEAFTNELGDILTMQDQIAAGVASKLKVKFSLSALPGHAVNQEAYDLYLKGRYYWNKRGEGLKTSLDYYHKAIELAPDFALAYSGLAESYLMSTFLDYMPSEGIDLCKQAAKKALSLNPKSSEALTCLGFVSMIYDREFEKANQYFTEAIAINANNAPSLYWYSIYQIQVKGDLNEALSLSKRAVEAEPLSFVPYSHCCYALTYMRRFEEAISYGKKTFELDSSNFLARHAYGQALGQAGRYKDAIKIARDETPLADIHPWLLIHLTYDYAMTGDTASAKQYYQEGLRRAEEGPFQLSYLGAMEANLGMYKEAIAHLKAGKEQKEALYMLSKNFLVISPKFKRTKEFVELVEELHEPDLIPREPTRQKKKGSH